MKIFDSLTECILSLSEDFLNIFEDELKNFFSSFKDFAKKYIYSSTFTLFLLIISLPFIFTRSCSWAPDFSNSGQVGDTFGIMNPFIAIIAAILTFVAFWTQYCANKEMLKKDEKQEVEHQFYEMLRIHKDNVNELKWTNWSIAESSYPYPINDTKSILKDKFLYNNKYAYQETVGRKVFDCHKIEYIFIEHSLKQAIQIIEKRHPIKIGFSETDFENYKSIIQLSYRIYMEGLSVLKKAFKNDHNAEKFFNKCENNPQSIANNLDQGNYSFLTGIGNPSEHLFNDIHGYIYLYSYFLLCYFKKNMQQYKVNANEIDHYLTGLDLFSGHIYELNHYYRHLYQTVKIVANFDEKILSYEEKRKFLRMLRAQLTSDEQLLLFYNWISGYGNDWECPKNHFFTKFRMIHNLNNKDSSFFQSVGAEVIIDRIKKTNPGYNDYKNDNLFEFEDRLN